MRLEIRSLIDHAPSQITATQVNPTNTRSSEEKPRKALKTQIWGQNPRFGAIGQIILKVLKK